MAVPAAGRCLCGGWPRGGVPPPGLPVVRRAAGVLVWLLASCPGGGPVPEDLRAPAAVRPVPGEPCAAAGVHAGLAAGCGRDGRRSDRAGGGWRVRRPAGGGPGGGSGYATGRRGWLGLGAWRFASSVSGGTLIAANTGSLFLVVGKRRFMPPVPSAPP